MIAERSNGSATRSIAALVLAVMLAVAPVFTGAAGEPPSVLDDRANAAEAGETASTDDGAGERALEPGSSEGRLPASRTTRHVVEVDGHELAFSVIAGALTLSAANGREEAEIAYVAYLLDGADDTDRPVTFAVNGGPGAASAYLHLGVLGPWRLAMGEAHISPSQPVDLVANGETWLDVTDLVFLDPVGTGFSRLIDADDRLRNRYLSVDGDIDALADAVSLWLVQQGRVASPVYFVGESYGGFRGPLLAETLQTDRGIALSGITLLSPVLDFGWRQQPAHAPLPRASLLPSLAAAAMEAQGTWSPEALAEVEAYAAGDYVVDLLRGLADQAAIERLVERLSPITGLEPEMLRRRAGRIEAQDFLREIGRDTARVASLYDTGVTAEDPTPERTFSRAADPVLDAMTAPLTRAMLALYRERFDWLPERRYVLLNRGVNRAWQWGRGGRSQPEALGALGRVMALDRSFKVLVAHGYTDLVTPYFGSELVLRQLRDFGPGERLRRATYPGGHMFYTRDGSRQAFRDDALWLYGLDD